MVDREQPAAVSDQLAIDATVKCLRQPRRVFCCLH